jgi:hypothetical protein
MRPALGLAVCIALLLGGTDAQAEQRYAAPQGTGSACSQPEPCSLAEATNKASNGDEVIVAAGEYAITGAPLNVVYAGLQLHGDLGGPMPRVVATLGGLPAISLSGEGISLSYLEIQNEETEGVGVRCFGAGSKMERVRAAGIGEGAAGAVVYPGCTVRNSLLLGRGGNSIGMESLGIAAGTTDSTASNVTAIATGENSAGIQSRYSESSSGSHTLVLANSIADGASDLRTEDGSGGPGRIVVSNSNFDSVKAETEGAIAGPANQAAPPLFVDAASGDYRPAAGSPTIDAGAPGDLGPLDLAGSQRVLGSAPDIGAYEFVPPPAPGVLTSLAIAPKAFRPLRSRGPIVSASKRRRARVGTTVRYSLTAAATVNFFVERAVRGRLVDGKCRRRTRANRRKRKCTRFVPLLKRRRGDRSFNHNGAAGENTFKFTGRLRNFQLTPSTKRLAPGRYRLVGRTGDSVKRAAFRIVK